MRQHAPAPSSAAGGTASLNRCCALSVPSSGLRPRERQEARMGSVPEPKGNGKQDEPRAPHGAGSVKQRKDGRWEVRLSLGYGPDGKRKVWRGYAKTETQAIRLRNKAIAEHERGQLAASDRQKLRDYLTYWLGVVEKSLEPKTFVEYQRYAERVIAPALGNLQLSKITAAHVQRLLDDLQQSDSETGKPRGPRYVEMVYAVIRKALNDAVGWQILGANPALHVILPKRAKKRRIIWTPEQVKAFLAAIRDDHDEAAYILAMLTGARLGELMGLTWDAINWEANTITLDQQVQRIAGQGLVHRSHTKSETSYRTIAVHPIGMDALRRQQERVVRWQAKAGEKWAAHGLVWPQRRKNSSNGKPRGGETLRIKLQKIAGRLGIPEITFHDLRHQHASLLIALDVPAKVIQERLGHSSIDVTMDLYGHLLPGMDRDAADRIGEQFKEWV